MCWSAGPGHQEHSLVWPEWLETAFRLGLWVGNPPKRPTSPEFTRYHICWRTNGWMATWTGLRFGKTVYGGTRQVLCIDIPVGPVRTWRGSSQLHAVCSRIAKSLREV
ncbi:hypothetical protein TWF217_003806 [Orbilia oligospora]|nr:hypothetical protein TWF128_006309 [Orbilia oligospora]KAF3271985.1 hypothetical protein TWF217_003806 [Orbilia oligospora]KAF3287208.1 hypothetical protein TWF132_008580 [Orbilia oligospora]